MMQGADQTHDPALTSWIPSANLADADFPIQNLPFGIFRRAGTNETPRAGVAIGDFILDVAASHAAGLFTGDAARAAALCADTSLNRLMALDGELRLALRRRLSELVTQGNNEILARRDLVERLLIPIAEAELSLPASVGDYSDFYASIHHATNVGRLFRPDNPLLPNYKYVPIGYHGRASSLVVSGTPIRRPSGQTKDAKAAAPAFGPSNALDYEVELGIFAGPGNSLGEPVPIAEAEAHIFGLCLVNDWSARDIQRWEYQPLGPFLAKSFATTISPWVVTLEALVPYRVPAFERAAGDPQPLPYLHSAADFARGAFDIQLELSLSTPLMRQSGVDPVILSRGNARDLFWTPAQMLTHHASNGCNLRPGDLLASGTISGATKGSQGCLLELTRDGANPIELGNGEERPFLQDGDEVTLRGYCAAPGYKRIGFGACRGRVVSS